jgi:large subunit ribosomal protein L15
MPLYMRIPKLRGFRSFRQPTVTIYTGQLDALGKTTVTSDVLAEAGLIANPYVRIKLVKKGDVTKKVAFKGQAASKTAIAALEAAGGSFEEVKQSQRPKTSLNPNKAAK